MNAWDISFSSLSVGYGDHAVLHDINATLPGGKVSVILDGAAAGSFADADVLILQNGIQQHAGPAAAAFKQLVFKISCSAYKILAPRSGQHGAERRHNVGLQNTAENHKAVQPGAHGIQLHHSQFLQECKNACFVYSV